MIVQPVLSDSKACLQVMVRLRSFEFSLEFNGRGRRPLSNDGFLCLGCSLEPSEYVILDVSQLDSRLPMFDKPL